MMQTQRLWRGLAVLALGLVLVWGIQATFAAPGGDEPNVEQANDHKPDHEQDNGNGNGNGNGGGRPDDAGPPENPGNGNGNADPGQPDNPGNSNGNGNTDPGPPDNADNGNGNAAQDEGEDDGDDEGDDLQAQGPSDKVLVCHVTSSANNSSELIEVSENAVAAHEAHGDTVGDDAADACEEDADGEAPSEATPDGSPVASPVAIGHKVLVCHVTSSDDNPFVLIEIDEHAVPAHEAHGDIVDVESADDCTSGTPVASPVADGVSDD